MYHVTQLPSGLKVASHRMKNYDSAALGIFIGVGGRYETNRLKGAAHFLEHILFKGSRRFSCNQIKKQIEGVGGSLNAFTAEEATCYFAKIPAKHLKTAFDVLSDMVLHPRIPPQEVQKERLVILEEIKMYHDLPQHLVLELLESMVWPGHPLGKSLAGTFDSVGAMTPKDLKAFHRRYYIPQNMIVCATGSLTHQDLLRLVRKQMPRLASGKLPAFEVFTTEQTRPVFRYRYRPIEQMHLAIGIPGLKKEHPDLVPLSLLNVVLGANMSSRLFNEVREKRGLAYAIGSASKSLQDTGLFLIRAGIENKKIVEATDVIFNELEKLKRRPVTQSEFSRAKDYLLGQILLDLEDTLEHMFWLGESVLTRKRARTLKEIVAKVRKITVADLRRVAREVFKQQKLNVAVVGPLKRVQAKQLQRLLGI